MTLGLAFNLYQEGKALPGFLEAAIPYFDDIVAIHSGPGTKLSDDGTLDILYRWGIRTVFDDIYRGYGEIRTRCLRESKADWVVILDADERFHPILQSYVCEGDERYPQVREPNLKVEKLPATVAQGDALKRAIVHAEPDVMGIVCNRRHWFDFSHTKPMQNWRHPDHKDYQLRIVRNDPNIGYRPEIKMHEQLIDYRTGLTPKTLHREDLIIDHYGPWFHKMAPNQRAEDIATYNKLDGGNRLPGDNS
jgi:glycosyltransferase involved in cell wall biosynthesis